MEKRNLIILIAFLMFLGFVYSANIQPIEEFYHANYGEFAVAVGTIILAYFTYDLAVTEIKEGKIERKRLRLKEQLEKFYSPLIGRMTEKNEDEFESVLKMQDVKDRYEFLASDALKVQLRDYYIQKRSSLIGVSVRSPEIPEEILSKLRERIMMDFEDLIVEYKNLS